MSRERRPLTFTALLGVERRAVLLSSICAMVGMGAGALVPWITAWVLDEGVLAQSFELVLQGAAGVILLAIIQAVLTTQRDSIAGRAGNRSAARVIVGVHESSLSGRSGLDSSEVVTMSASDSRAVGRAIDAVSLAVGSCAAVVSAVVAVAISSWQASLALIVGLLAAVYLSSLLLAPLNRRQRDLRKTTPKLAKHLLDSLAGLSDLWGLPGSSRRRVAQFTELADEARRHSLRVARLSAVNQAVRVLASGVIIVVVLIFGAWLVSQQALSVGGVIALYTYLVFLREPLGTILTTASRWSRAAIAFERVSVLDDEAVAPPSVSLQAGTGAPHRTMGFVISAEVRSPDDIRTIVESVTGVDSAAMIGPRDHVMGGTVRSIIDPETARPDDLVLAGLRLEGVLSALPQGLDTHVARPSVQFSAGELQRLRLASALRSAPDRVIFLDATKGIDASTQPDVIETLLRERRSSALTAFVTTNPGLLSNLDEIVMHDGSQVIARGQHPDLLHFEDYRRRILGDDS